ncbi:hypothetical protein TNCV_324991 [Trichonephila clavipes]|nr:hypothetical protein TNCV_324991 [Trichonephila clavipes]
MDWTGWSSKLAGMLAKTSSSGGHMKSIAYASLIDYDEALVARIAVVAGDIREMHGVFANVRQSLRWRREACIFADGRSFEQLFVIPQKNHECTIFSKCHHSFNLHSYALRVYIKLFLFYFEQISCVHVYYE